MLDISEGIEMDTGWFNRADPVETETKLAQSEIIESIHQPLNFDTTTNRFHRSESLQDACVKLFPRVNLLERGKLERLHVNEIGVLVCRMYWDEDQ